MVKFDFVHIQAFGCSGSYFCNITTHLFLVRKRSAAGMIIRTVVLVVGPLPRLSCEPMSGALKDVFVFKTAALPGSTVTPRTDTSYSVDGCKSFN